MSSPRTEQEQRAAAALRSAAIRRSATAAAAFPPAESPPAAIRAGIAAELARVRAHPAERGEAVVERRGVAVLGREPVVDADTTTAPIPTQSCLVSFSWVSGLITT